MKKANWLFGDGAGVCENDGELERCKRGGRRTDLKVGRYKSKKEQRNEMMVDQYEGWRGVGRWKHICRRLKK
jgi:hypothetical protein